MADQIGKRRRRSSHTIPSEFTWDRFFAGGRKQRKSRLIFLRWLFLMALTALAFLVILWNLKNRQQASLPESTLAKPKETVVEISAPPVSPEEKSEAAIAKLLEFVNAHSHPERVLRIYQQTKPLEQLIEYYDQRGNALPQRIINPAVSALSVKDRELLLVSFTDQDGRQWSAPFEWKNSSYHLHWEAMVGFGEISWIQFFQERPREHFIMRANFFLPENDEVQPLATDRIIVLMSHPELANAVSVEVLIDSEVHQHLMEFPRLTDIPAMVDLYWPEGENGMPRLSRWLQRDWIER